MKRRLLTLFSLLLTLLLSVPAMAQDYLAVYLNDGTVDRHMLPLMKSSYASKLDKQGIPHADYVTHVIEMKSGAKYTYDVEMIDSITFAKVDLEEVVETTCNVVEIASALLEECSTADQMEEHIDQLTSIQGVESVKRKGDNSFKIQIKDGRPLFILFDQPEEQDLEMQTSAISKALDNATAINQNVNSNIRVAVANAQSAERPYHVDYYFTPLVNYYKEMGYDAVHVEMPKVNFFEEEITDYNVVVFCTHGVYDDDINRHWHLTGETTGAALTELGILIMHEFQKDDYDYDEIGLAVSNKTNGRYYLVKMISEQFIANRTGNFHREGPKIFFDIACEALKGNTECFQNNSNETFTADLSFANTLLGKGINEYFGYSETNSAGQRGSYLLSYNLLNGESAETAYNHLPQDVLRNVVTDDNNHTTIANLLRVVNQESDDATFIISVYTGNVVYRYSNMMLTLNGTTTHIENDLRNVTLGFQYGLDSSFSDWYDFPIVIAQSSYFEIDENGNLHFSTNIPIPAVGVPIYYRAFMADSFHTAYGEIKSVSIESTPVSNIHFDYAEQSMYVGDSRELNCIIEPFNATNPVLEWNSSNPSIATVDQNGVVTALAPGECTITASTTDGSGLMASCVITVTERLDAGDYAYVDLGLPSGLMWATCNIGAQNPYDFGDKFAWGETATKQKFTWSTYTWCNGGNTSITKYCAESNFGTVDGLTQLEPEDDAAHIQWGGVWRMPTYDEQVELKDNCYWQWTSGYNGSNVAGFIVYKAKAESDRGKHSYNNPSLSASYSLSDTHIFLPAAGYMANTTMSYEGVLGSYWSSTLRAGNSANANCFNIYSSKAYNEGSQRCAGLSIRPVW